MPGTFCYAFFSKFLDAEATRWAGTFPLREGVCEELAAKPWGSIEKRYLPYVVIYQHASRMQGARGGAVEALFALPKPINRGICGAYREGVPLYCAALARRPSLEGIANFAIAVGTQEASAGIFNVRTNARLDDLGGLLVSVPASRLFVRAIPEHQSTDLLEYDAAADRMRRVVTWTLDVDDGEDDINWIDVQRDREQMCVLMYGHRNEFTGTSAYTKYLLINTEFESADDLLGGDVDEDSLDVCLRERWTEHDVLGGGGRRLARALAARLDLYAGRRVVTFDNVVVSGVWGLPHYFWVLIGNAITQYRFDTGSQSIVAVGSMRVHKAIPAKLVVAIAPLL